MQNLNLNDPIVTPDGTPTEYFMRLLQERGVLQSDTDALLEELLARQIIAGDGLDGGGTLGDPGNITLTADVQEILDQISTTRGVILYRGNSAWAALAPGTSGHFLKTNGAGADPAWAAVSSSGSMYGPALGRGGATATFTAGFVGAIPVLLRPNETISTIGFYASAASASTVWRVGVYSDSSGAMGTLQASQSGTTTGVVAGINEGTLSSTYTNTSGALQQVWIAIVTSTAANFTITTGHSLQCRNWNNGSATFPASAPAQTTGTQGWIIWARP